MIEYAEGNLLDDPAEALVNTVNEVGVMGKGVALMFKERFPENAEEYEIACREKRVKVGTMLVTKNRALWGPRWVIHFPTKKHWRFPSKLEWIREGMQDLVRVLRDLEIHSVALPPLGCGNGGLEWSHVKRVIESALSQLPEVQARVYIPTRQYHNAPKREGLSELSPARAMIAELVRQYAILGLDCTNLEVQKLAWFLSRSIRRLRINDPLRLTFTANKFGPYSDALRHLLNGLDGSFLHCEKRLSDAGAMDVIWFEDSQRDRLKAYLQSGEAAPYLPALKETSALIDGFESPLGMEVMATLDWLVINNKCDLTARSVKEALTKWPGQSAARRKTKLFEKDLVDHAIRRLTDWYSANRLDETVR